MKKLLKISAVIFVIGAILLGIGIAMRGFKPFSIAFKNGKVNIEDGQQYTFVQEKTEIDSFTNIDINTNVSEIRIIPSDSYAIEYSTDSSNFDYEVKNDSLVVTSTGEAVNISVNFTSKKDYLYIYVPSDCQLNDITITSSVGDIDINSQTCESLSIDLGVGDININNSNFSSVNIDSDTGDVEGSSVTISSDLTIQNDVGDTEISLTAGNYNIDLETDCGDITVNGNDVDDGVSQSFHESNNGASISISANTGDIEVNY